MGRHENQKICQSCAMPLYSEDVYGTNADGSKNEDYCKYCYENGEFTSDVSMDEMMNFCIGKMLECHPDMDKDEATMMMKEVFPKLKRWSE